MEKRKILYLLLATIFTIIGVLNLTTQPEQNLLNDYEIKNTILNELLIEQIAINYFNVSNLIDKQEVYHFLFFLEDKPCSRCIHETVEYLEIVKGFKKEFEKELRIDFSALFYSTDSLKAKRYSELIGFNDSFVFFDKNSEIEVKKLEPFIVENKNNNKIVILDMIKKREIGTISILNQPTEQFRKKNILSEILF